MFFFLFELSLSFVVAMICEYVGSYACMHYLKASHLKLLKKALERKVTKHVSLSSYLINLGLTLSLVLLFNLALSSPFVIVLLTSAVFITFTIAHLIKLSILKEPLVWSDFLLVKEIYLHPSFYFAYVSKKIWVVIGCLICALLVGVVLLELFTAKPALSWGLVTLFLILSLIFNFMLLKILSYHKSLTFIPALDGLQGANAILVLQLAILIFRRHEYEKLFVKLKFRGSNQDLTNSNHDVGLAPSFEVDGGTAKPNFNVAYKSVILIQAESYVSLETLGSEVKLNVEAQAQAEGSYALLDLDYQGAYTMRTEFSVLTGLNRYELGIYAYDPYLVAQKIPLNSLAWKYKALGFKTICIHPNEKEFFARHKVMANLGFDKFIALDELKTLKRHGPHISDEALLEFVRDLVLNSQDKLFVFVITMEAHGPWLQGRFADDPNRSALECYERHLQSLDLGLNKLIASGLQVVVYGDHEPSLPKITATKTCQNDLLPLILAFNTKLRFKGILGSEKLHQMVLSKATEGRNA